MLEIAIKNLTVAIEALTAATLGDSDGPADTASHIVTAIKNAPPTAATASPTPVQTAPAAMASPVFNVATPDPGSAAAPLTFDLVKAQLSAVIQKMGDGGAAVSALVATYPDATGQPAKLLSTVDATLWPDLVAKAKELINA